MPLGVINVAIVDAVVARERRYALGIGLGGALADATHALLAAIGLARVITARPELARGLAIAAAAVIVVFAITAWRRRRITQASAPADPSAVRGVLAGIAMTLPNPGALAAWVAVAAMVPVGGTAAAIAFALGVGLGSALWFTVLGRLVARIRPDHPALRWTSRIALLAFVALAAVAVVQAL